VHLQSLHQITCRSSRSSRRLWGRNGADLLVDVTQYEESGSFEKVGHSETEEMEKHGLGTIPLLGWGGDRQNNTNSKLCIEKVGLGLG